jgi:hypothetical protein
LIESGYFFWLKMATFWPFLTIFKMFSFRFSQRRLFCEYFSTTIYIKWLFLMLFSLVYKFLISYKVLFWTCFWIPNSSRIAGWNWIIFDVVLGIEIELFFSEHREYLYFCTFFLVSIDHINTFLVNVCVFGAVLRILYNWKINFLNKKKRLFYMILRKTEISIHGLRTFFTLFWCFFDRILEFYTPAKWAFLNAPEKCCFGHVFEHLVLRELPDEIEYFWRKMSSSEPSFQ